MIQILPGTSVIVQAGERTPALVAQGIVAIPLALDWGDTSIEIGSTDGTLYTLGYKRSNYNGSGMKHINEVLRSADKIVIYRSNIDGGVKASGTVVTGVTATAKYVGTRGNDIDVTVTASDSLWIIKTFVDSIEVDSQTVSDFDEFVANDFISISGTGTIAAASISLTNGANGTPRSNEADLWLAELATHTYNVIAYAGSTAATITALRAFVDDQRAQDNMIQAVASNVAANNEAFYNCTVGGETLDYSLTAGDACATLAGIIAKQGITGSLTHYPIDWWTDTNPHLTHEQMESRVQTGELIVAMLYGVPTVVYDINSLTTYTAEKPQDFHKGLIMRTLDNYAMNLQNLLDTRAIGKIRNSIDGRAQIKALINDMTVTNYLDLGYIENDFTADDITVSAGAEIDAVTATVGIHPVDTADKIQVTVTSLA